MVVLHLISSSGYYGAENMLVSLARGLGRLGSRPIVAVFQNSRNENLDIAEEAARHGLTTELVPCAGRWDSGAVDRIRELIQKHGADVLHTHGYKADVIGRAAAWGQRPAVVATCHNWPDPRPSMRAYAVLDRLLLRTFDGVAAASEPLADLLQRWGMRAARALPNGVEIGSFTGCRPTIRHLMPEGADRLIGFVGRLTEEKGGSFFIRSARKIVDAWPGAAFVMVGDGPCEGEWKALAERLGIASRVLFTGARRDMPGVYESLDALMLTSMKEALPMCLLEAMAAGRPVIATAVGSVPSVVVPGVTGFLVAPGDVDALADAALAVLADPERARAIAGRGRDHICRHYSNDAAAAAYLELYRSALARRGRAHVN